MRIKNILDSGDVVRSHCAPVKDKQLLSSHHWETAVILEHIYPECSKALLFYALTHDTAELFTGDLPATIKMDSPVIKHSLDSLEHMYESQRLGIHRPTFSDVEMLAVKWADVISGIYFTRKRIEQGDRLASPVLSNWMDYANNLPHLNQAARTAVGEVQ